MKAQAWIVLFLLVVAYALASLLGGCTAAPVKAPEPIESIIVEPQSEPMLAPAPAKLPALPWAGKHKDADKWSAHLIVKIAESNLPSVVPKDYAKVCKSYEALSKEMRVQVWANLISKMAKYESGYKPGTSFKEGFSDSKGLAVISRGLLQISQESANSYGCGIKEASQLHDAIINLSCAVKILDRWAGRDKVFSGYAGGKYLGGGRYWAVMRSTKNGKPRESYNGIMAHMRALSFCQ